MDKQTPRHPIRVVAKRTGLTPATLRAWERRYKAVVPGRSDSGQRLYSDHDVDRLLRLRRLSDAGRPISLLAGMTDEETQALLAEDKAAAQPVARVDEQAGLLIDQAFERVVRLDADGLDSLLRRGSVTLGAARFLEEVVVPLLHRVGEEWAAGLLAPGHEHLCTEVVERVLSWLTEPIAASASGPVVLVATLPGEHHGLGARLAATSASLAGCRVTYLGSDLPVEDSVAAARALNASAVALSVVNVERRDVVLRHLKELREELPGNIRVIVGGGGASSIGSALLPDGIDLARDLDGLRAFLLS